MCPGRPEIESDPSEFVVKTCWPVCWPLTVIVCWSDPGSIVTVIVWFPLSVSISVDVFPICSAKIQSKGQGRLIKLWRWTGGRQYHSSLTISHVLLDLLWGTFLKVPQFQVTSQVARLSDRCWANGTRSGLFWLWFGFRLWKRKWN